MKNSPASHGRISDHSHGIGTVTSELVTQRARELGVINGRDHGKFTEADWQQARRELAGENNSSDEQVEEPVSGLTKWDEKPDTSEHRVPNSPPTDDDESVAEQLVREGVEEANHDLMLNGSRTVGREI